MRIPVVLLATPLLLAAAPKGPDLIVSSNDGHSVFDDARNIVAPKQVNPDTITLIDVTARPPRIYATFEAPGSVVGPPGAVWVSPDQSWGIVTSATKADPNGKFGISVDDRVAVFEMAGGTPKVVQSLTSGPGATQVRVSPNGKLALIANRMDGTVSVFTVQDRRLTPAGKVNTGNEKSLPSAVVFVDDRTALLTRGGDNMVSVLHIDGTNVTIDPRPVTTGMAPYSMDINAAHTLAAVSNMGRGEGDTDSVSLIDLKSSPFRTASTTGVASGPEPLKFSPDGHYLAVGAENGTTKAANHPFHAEHGLLAVYAVEGKALRKVAEAPAGGWLEAVAFSRDGKTVLIQSMADRAVEVFRWDGHKLTRGLDLKIDGAGPESFAAAWP